MIEAHEGAPREFLPDCAHIVRPARLVPTRVVVEIPRHNQVSATAETCFVPKAARESPGPPVDTFRAVIVIPGREEEIWFRRANMDGRHDRTTPLSSEQQHHLTPRERLNVCPLERFPECLIRDACIDFGSRNT